MLLENVAHFNDLTPEMRNNLEAKIKGFGKVVRYKFDIGRDNPDPEKWGGIKTVWPAAYTLDPCVFDITDREEKRAGKTRSKKIGLVDGVDKDNKPDRFKKIRIYGRDRGVLSLNVESSEEDFQKAMYLELHPKQKGGGFSNENLHQVFSRIDENAYANEQRKERNARRKALNAVEDMTDRGLVDFADAMSWDSARTPEVLRNEIEQLAETSPEFFNDLVSGKNIEYQAAVKQAMNKKILSFDPAEYKYIWTSNSQTITVLSPSTDKNEIEKLAEWLQVGGEGAQAVYKKIKGLIEPTK